MKAGDNYFKTQSEPMETRIFRLVERIEQLNMQSLHTTSEVTSDIDIALLAQEHKAECE